MKVWIKIALSLGSIVGLERFCYFQTAGFRDQKIAYDGSEILHPIQQEDAAEKLLDQPFYFFGSGVQCYVFLGQDQKTILKVFKHYHAGLSTPFLKKLPLKEMVKERQKRMKSILDSCLVAYEDYKEETGLLYIHLQKTDHLAKKLTLIDKLGIAHTIDLDTTLFVLQERAELIYPYIDHLMQQKQQDLAEKALESLLSLILKRMEKGINNQDPILERNFGFLGEKPVEIDIGSFKRDPIIKKSYRTRREFFYEALQLKEWVAKTHPTLLPSLEKAINEKMR